MVISNNSIFSNKSVCIVGGDSSLLGKGYGANIDRNDLVIRINFPNSTKVKDLGKKIDIRFIGATLLPKHNEVLQCIDNELIVTNNKNKESFLKTKNILFSVNFSRSMFCIFYLKFKIKLSVRWISKPPRSGVVFLMYVILSNNYKTIELYGFSSGITGFLSCYGQNGLDRITHYDSKVYGKNHCSVDDELYLLNKISLLPNIKFL